MSFDILGTSCDQCKARFNKIHIRKVYACLAVTCHLHFWQNDRDFLRATAVTRGWNGYRNKSQHRKSTLEKKILPPFQQGFEPATFQSRVRCSNHWAIPAPRKEGSWKLSFIHKWLFSLNSRPHGWKHLFHVFFHLVLVNWMEGLLIPACPSLIHVFNSGSVEGTYSSEMCIWCSCMLYDLFYICIGMDFVDLTEEKVCLYYIEREEFWNLMCIYLQLSLMILRWPFVVDRTLKSSK